MSDAAAYVAMRLLGRCANGNEADGGRIYHIKGASHWKALCGAQPGRRSAGWADHPDATKPVEQSTCLKCLERFLRLRDKADRSPSPTEGDADGK
jgi:hypothetical protein